LEHLEWDLMSSNLNDEKMPYLAKAISKLKNLKKLQLDISMNPEITEEGYIEFMGIVQKFRFARTLERFKFINDGNDGVTQLSLNKIFFAMNCRHEALKELELQLSCCDGLSTFILSDLSMAFLEKKSNAFKQLILNFKGDTRDCKDFSTTSLRK
jgi:hypothetical protein